MEVKVPYIGSFRDMTVISIAVRPSDSVKTDEKLITLESEEATIDVPTPMAGVVETIAVKIGDKLSEGSPILALTTGPRPAAAASAEPPSVAPESAPQPPVQPSSGDKGHASPSVRQFAREKGVDMSALTGSGPKSRILREDVQAAADGSAVAGPLAARKDGTTKPPVSPGTALTVLPWPKMDFAQFGPIEAKPLSRIKKISGATLHRNWVMIPHVTNHDEADITSLESFRLHWNRENEKAGLKLSLLPFLVKAVCANLKQFPEFNAALNGDELVLKRYYHIGFATDTPNGLVVPIVRDADKKGVEEIAREISELTRLAREGRLKVEQMQGGTFTISSLGGIGGTQFTPIINAPEVAIMGVCKSYQKPVWDGTQFVPRLTLPLSLSWDHRVLDGAAAARFNVHFAAMLGDLRRLLM